MAGPYSAALRCPAAVDACVICGPRHPRGLHVRFRRQGDRVTARFVPRPEHQGFHGLFSGGLLAAIFDCLTYRVVLVQGVVAAVTARLEVDYRAPMPLGRALRFEAWLQGRRGRVFDIAAQAWLGERVAGAARVVYVEVPAERLPAPPGPATGARPPRRGSRATARRGSGARARRGRRGSDRS